MTAQFPLIDTIALVTGATRGIGRALAVGLAEAGAHVIAVGRTQGALEALDDEIRAVGGLAPTLAPLNLEQPDEIDVLGRAIYDRWGRLDILVSAAGLLGGLTPVAHAEPKVWERVVSVNLSANYRLIRSLDPLLRAAPAGRAVFLTSGAASNPRAFWGAYAASKAGLDALVACYADETAHTPVQAVAVNPGAMRTRMRAEAFPGEDPAGLPHPRELTPLILELVRPDAPRPQGVVSFKAWREARKA